MVELQLGSVIPPGPDQPKIGSLFSGYGGLDMAAEAAFGATTAWVSDIDPGACKVLAHRYPYIPNLGDITAIDWSTVEPIDLITGGSPCQDLSHAGKRGGMTEGTRSNLWVAMRDAIAQLRPTYVVWENVRGAYSAEADSDLGPCPGCLDDPRERGPVLRALGRVLEDLSDLGYDARWVGLRAADVGFAHGRFRVFVVAHTRGVRRGAGWPAGSSEAQGGRSHGDAAGRRLLPTPSVADALGGHLTRSGARSSELLLPGVAKQLGSLLPTPRATDGTKGGPNQRGSSGDLMLPSAVARLIPTPLASDTGPRGGTTGFGLRDWSRKLLPTPTTEPTTGNGHARNLGAEASAVWAEYADAVVSQESVTRPAPPPTERAPKGGQRLSCRFDEWLMGLPDGWITDIPGITHNEALKLCGNGVVPQQAYAALVQMLGAEVAA